MSVTRMLTGHELFQSFLPEQVAVISGFSAARKLDRGEVIYGPDQKVTHVFVLLDGQVELRLSSGAVDSGVLVGRVGKGEMFGIAPLVDAASYTTSAICTKASKVLFIEAKPLIRMIEANPSIGHKVMTTVAGAYFNRYQRLIERVQKALVNLALEE